MNHRLCLPTSKFPFTDEKRFPEQCLPLGERLFKELFNKTTSPVAQFWSKIHELSLFDWKGTTLIDFLFLVRLTRRIAENWDFVSVSFLIKLRISSSRSQRGIQIYECTKIVLVESVFTKKLLTKSRFSVALKSRLRTLVLRKEQLTRKTFTSSLTTLQVLPQQTEANLSS